MIGGWQGQFGTEFGALDAEEGFDIAHIGILSEQLLAQCQVGRHIDGGNDEDEVGAGRDAPALLHAGFGHGFVLELQQRAAVLPVQRDFHNGLQAMTGEAGDVFAAQDGDLFLDQTQLLQAFDPA